MNSNDSFLNVVIKLKASVLLSYKKNSPESEHIAKYLAWGENTISLTFNLNSS